MITSLIALSALLMPSAGSSVYTVGSSNGIASFVSPSGQKLWSFGVDCAEPGPSRKDYKASNKSYAAFRFFTSDKEWVDDTIQKLREWGFNSTGGWSDDDLFRKYGGSKRLPYFVVLHLGAWDQAPWHDIFDKDMDHWVNVAAQKQIPPIANDPDLVGYFSDNELGWWDDTLFWSYLAMKPAAPGRKKLIETLQKFYQNDFAKLQKDWIADGNSFATIRALHLRPGGSGRKAVDAWTQTIGERYYSLMQTTIRKYDKRHLILGDRYCQYYTLPMVRAAAKYVDVISTNYGADWNDGSITPFFLRTLHTITNKPVIITEFYMCAKENRSGNKNSGTFFPVVQTQKERANAFAHYMRSVSSLPYVVGAHWFQFSDEPANGRGDGENFNMGLVDDDGRPYEELTAACESLDLPAIRSTASDPVPGKTVGVPLISSNPFDGLKDWPRAKGVLPASNGTPFGDLYAARDKDNFYLGLIAMDYMDEKLYIGGHVTEIDRNRWQIKIAGLSKPIDIRYGGKGQKASINTSGIEIHEISGLKYVVMIKIPRSMIKAQEPVRIWSSADTHGRSAHMEWKAELLGVAK